MATQNKTNFLNVFILLRINFKSVYQKYPFKSFNNYEFNISETYNTSNTEIQLVEVFLVQNVYLNFNQCRESGTYNFRVG